MAYLDSQIPLDVSAGVLQPRRFCSIPLFQWKKVPVNILVERMLGAVEGTEGLDEVREIVARKSKEAITVLLSTKSTMSQREKILKITEHMECILLCRHFIFPAIFFRIKDFIQQDIHPQEAELLHGILGQQEHFQKIVLQYGHLSDIRERGNSMKPISDLIQVFQKLPTKKQPIQLIESLQNPETNEKTRKQIQSYYKALKNKRR